MSMIDCIKKKITRIVKRAELMTEMHNDIEALWSMQMRLRKTGASSDILVMLSRAREQISKERSKMVAEMRKGEHE